MAIGRSLLPIISSIYKVNFENLALDLAQYKLLLSLHYIDDTFLVRSHGPEQLQNFFQHLNSLRSTVRFTMEIELGSVIPFSNDLSSGRGWHWPPKPTHTDWYNNFNSSHPLHVKRVLIRSVNKRSSTICQECRDLCNEISSLRCDLQLNGYPQGFVDSVIN
jgi:hypothetical protein